jgi:plasmid segregation protein ParM
MESGDTSDSEASLYGRERYFNPMYHVISEVGLGLGLIGNQYGERGNDKIVVQTGLPEKYMGDEYDLKDSLAGNHDFALRIGSGDWIKFSFTIGKDDIYVMSQPKGTLFSICIDRNGRFHPDAANYLSSNILVFDPGFGTLDLFPIMSGVVGHGETYPDLGMKRVLQETAKLIKENYNVDIPVPAMQKYLETGTVRYVNKKTFQAKEYPFGKLLSDASSKVCDEAINRMMSAVSLIDYNYLIVTGGTGAAWLHHIQDKFKDFSTLKILSGNQNDELAFIYSNVRGYYLYRYNKLGRKN